MSQNMPVEGELVLCTVTRVQNHSVFVKLDHYDRSAMLHISEVSPGRIRNLREYVTEGKIIVCKVLSINLEKGHIDVSLRRVTESLRVQFLTNLKQSAKAKKFVEEFCKANKLDSVQVLETMKKTVQADYEQLYESFVDFIKGEYAFSASGLTAPLHEKFLQFLKVKIKPPQVEITGTFKIISFAGDGIEQIKKVLTVASAIDPKFAKITYGGGGFYYVKITCEEFGRAEKILKQITDVIEPAFSNRKDALYEFTRNDGKTVQA